MNKQLIVKQNELELLDIQNTQKMCQLLIQSPHYKKMGSEGVFAIVEQAKAIGVSPVRALNGGMYFVRGKVEMSSRMMASLIRSKQHSITKDKKSNETICILHGKRKDNGDTWVESFSMEDAKRAGLLKNPTWQYYPQDMLYARALSRLARNLFPDLIGDCYVQGEIADAIPLNSNEKCCEEVSSSEHLEEQSEQIESVSDSEFTELEKWLGDNYELRANIISFLKRKFGIEELRMIPREFYNLALDRAKKQFIEQQEALGEQYQMEA